MEEVFRIRLVVCLILELWMRTIYLSTLNNNNKTTNNNNINNLSNNDKLKMFGYHAPIIIFFF